MRISNLMVLGAVMLGLAACGNEAPLPEDTSLVEEVPSAADAPAAEDVQNPTDAIADESHDVNLVISGVWARVNPIPGRPAAVYLSVASLIEDELIGAETPVAERTELHTHAHSDGMMRMMKVDSFAVAAGAPLSLQPGGDHIMLFGPDEGLAELESFPMTLQFRNAGTVDVIVSVGEPGA